MICKICDKEYKDRKALHLHLRFEEKMRLEKYYHTYYPRKDLYDLSPIIYKDADQYLEDEFNSRENMISYLKGTVSDKEKFIVESFEKRRNKKQLSFAPSTVECRSCNLPSPALVEYSGSDYNKLCSQAGLICKYQYNSDPNIPVRKNYKIFRDNREQIPLEFSHETMSTTLSFGDYALVEDERFNNIFVELKRAPDLIQSTTRNKKRLIAEFARAKELGAYAVVVCDTPLNVMLKIEEIPQFRKFTKVTSSYLFHEIRELCQEFENIQFVFCPHARLSDFVHKILLLGEQVKNCDLQYLVDKKVLL